MKKFILTLCVLFGIVLVLFLGAVARAEEVANPITVNVKQGFVMTWNDARVKNLTTFETIKTKKVESWGKWNALYEGWSIDAGFTYDATGMNTGAILLGRQFGTLADYLPLDFPLLKKVTVTIYPVGLYIEDLTDHPRLKGCSGGAFINLELKF